MYINTIFAEFRITVYGIFAIYPIILGGSLVAEQGGGMPSRYSSPSHRHRKVWRMRRIVLLLASMVVAVGLVAALPATARQLMKVEAEQAAVGTWGAVVNDTTASGGKAVRWNTESPDLVTHPGVRLLG